MSDNPKDTTLSDSEFLRLNTLCSELVDGNISEKDHAELEALILENKAAREHYVRTLQLSASLYEYAEEPQMEMSHSTTKSTSKKIYLFSPYSTAAAGLMVGIFITLFANSYLEASPYLRKVYELVMESFESEPAPLQKGVPDVLDVWSGDYSQVIGNDQTIEPFQGKKMLKLIAADYEEKSTKQGFMGDLYRFADLKDVSSLIKAKPHKVKFSAKLNHVGNTADTELNGVMTLMALSSFDLAKYPNGELKPLSEFGALVKTGSASTHRRIPLGKKGMAWEDLSCELLLPADTEVIYIHIAIMDLKKQKVKHAVKFAGSYIDDIQVYLEEVPPTFALK